MNAPIDMTASQSSSYPNRLPQSGSILYVDCDQAMRRRYGRVLENEGYTVRTAGDGMEGWELVQRQNFDLIVTSNEMPRLSGLEFAQRIRDEGLRPSLIIATETIGPLLNSNLSAIRFSAILHKPFSTVDLLAAVRRVLRVNPVDRGAGVVAGLMYDNQHLEHATALSRQWGINE